VRVPPADYLPPIWGAVAATSRFDTPEHDAYVAALFARHLAAIERDLAEGEAIEPWINRDFTGIEGALWARGYLNAMQQCKDEWQLLIRTKQLAERLMVPLIVLLPDQGGPADAELLPHRRWELIEVLLPDIVAATWAYWRGRDHRLLDVPRERAPKIGRNEPCPCGSGKKYKRCCGAAA
jgi:uncharacterized protein